MPLFTTIGAVLATKCTLSYLTECIIDSSAASAIQKIPKLGERLRKQFSDTRPEVNGHLQKAILSSHWMATLVFVEQMYKKNLLSEAYNNVYQAIKKELKLLRDEHYHPEENNPGAYDAAKLIKLPKEEEVIRELRTSILDFHLSQLNHKTGNVKSLTDYRRLLNFIRTGWADENLDWFPLMTAFLNQLLKGDNNNAKDAFQNQTLATIQLKLDSFEKYAGNCVNAIGEERFRSFEEALFDEIAVMRESLAGLHKKVENIYEVVVRIEAGLLEITKNQIGEKQQISLNIYEQYSKLISDIDALKIEVDTLEQKKKETLEFIVEEQNERKKARFEEDYTSLESTQLEKRGSIEEKQKELTEFTANIQRTWLSVYAGDSPRLSEAQEALKNGDLAKANSILDDKVLRHDFDLIEKMDEALEKKKESLALEYIAKADLTVTRKSSLDWFELAEQYYDNAVKLHPSYTTYNTYAIFLYNHKQFNRAFPLFEKVLIYSSNSVERGYALNNLGLLQSDQNELGKAEKSYTEALEIFKKLQIDYHKAYLPDVATTLNNLGILHRNQNELGKAEKSYIEALEIRRKLAIDNPAYLPDVATTLNNLGVLQQNQNEREKAEKSHREALDIYRKLAVDNPKAYLHDDLAMTLNNLGVLQEIQNELGKAEKSHREALDIYKKLAVDNPKAYLPHVAMTLNNLGVLQQNQNELGKAEKSHREALDIYRKLAVDNPKAYLPHVATTLNNLGVLQKNQNDLDKAEKSHIEALEIRRKLAQDNPVRSSIDYATTAVNLAFFYRFSKKNKAESIHFAQIAIQYFSPFSATVPYAAQWQKIAEEILKAWENEEE